MILFLGKFSDDRKQLIDSGSPVNGGSQSHSHQQNHHHGQPQDVQQSKSKSSNGSTNTTSNTNNNNTSVDVHQYLQQHQHQQPHEHQQAHSHHNFLEPNGLSLGDPFGSMNSSKALSLGSRSSEYGLMATSQLYGQLPASLSPLSHVSL